MKCLVLVGLWCGCSAFAEHRNSWPPILIVCRFTSQIAVPDTQPWLVEFLTSACEFQFEGRLTQSASWAVEGAPISSLESTQVPDEVVLGRVRPPAIEKDAATPLLPPPAKVDNSAVSVVASATALASGATVPALPPPSGIEVGAATGGACIESGEVVDIHTDAASTLDDDLGVELQGVAVRDLECRLRAFHPFDYLNIVLQATAVARLLERPLDGTSEHRMVSSSHHPAVEVASLVQVLCALKTNCHAITAMLSDEEWSAAAPSSPRSALPSSSAEKKDPSHGPRLLVNAIHGAPAIPPRASQTRRAPRSHVRSVVDDVSQRRVGVAVFPSAAMVNHSCRPNAVVRFQGSCVHVVATERVARGAAVCISYGPLAARHRDGVLRRRLLQQQYYFQCHCVACRAELPSASQRSPRDARQQSHAAASSASIPGVAVGTLQRRVRPRASKHRPGQGLTLQQAQLVVQEVAMCPRRGCGSAIASPSSLDEDDGGALVCPKCGVLPGEEALSLADELWLADELRRRAEALFEGPTAQERPGTEFDPTPKQKRDVRVHAAAVCLLRVGCIT